MNIGVDATVWSNNRGYGRHARALLSTLVQIDVKNRYIFVTDDPDGQRNFPENVSTHFVPTKTPVTVAASSTSRRSLADMWQMSRGISSLDTDILLFPTVYTYIPVTTRAKIIVMIHDVIPEIFPHLTVPNPTSRLFWKIKSALSRWQADAIVTVSEYSRKRIIEHFKLAPEQIFVVSEACDPVFRVLEHPGSPDVMLSNGISNKDRIVVYVGGFGPHKNLSALIQVFGRLAREADYKDVRLLLVGEYKKEVFYSEYQVLQSSIAEFHLQDVVIFTGYLTDQDLVAILNQATVLVLPSLMEGFGLPAVEAAASGCPVVATACSPLPDLLGDGGIYFDPDRSEQLEDALRRVLGSPALRQRMREAGIRAANNLSWHTAAQQMISVFQTITG